MMDSFCDLEHNFEKSVSFLENQKYIYFHYIAVISEEPFVCLTNGLSFGLVVIYCPNVLSYSEVIDIECLLFKDWFND